ncbi:zinc metalloprotease [Actinoplanes sp. LDG1-06]|uniref:Zinc metalloprotease n=1 Tax=Paractinoplanes ovalisporus TaxID=2810368 RepID=A0ABS2APS1_9ACTN|nr:zinc metalloprotease [Actinoplanes ovalisporus]MBM2621842.1 zinc metalloprotease [Actinoplanes ovalisporus]
MQRRRISTVVIGVLGAALITAPSSGVAVAAADSVAACTSVSSERVRGNRPGGSDPNDLTRSEATQAEKQMTAKLRSKGLTWKSKVPRGQITIDVRVHVITRADGTGGVTKKQIADQIAVLNAAYGGRTSPFDARTIFRFTTKSVDYTRNDDWFDWADPDVDPSDDQEAKAALHRGGYDDLNIYIAGLSGGLLGYAYYPNEATLIQDGVVVLNESLPGGAAAPYNEGDTLTHEVGHWLGLYHTFENGCTAPGDQVFDTPYQADGDNIFECNESDDTCPAPGRDPVHNFMSYGDDPCLDRFTLGQSIRMALIWFAYRAG